MSLRYFRHAARSRDAVFAGAALVAVIVLGLSTPADAQTAQDTTAQGQDQSQGVLPAPAAEESELAIAFNVGVQSDYVFRGVSQTEEDPSVFAGVDLTYDTFYAGAWASNVEYPGDSDTNAEIDLYGGLRPVVGDWTFDLGAIAYIYTNQPDGADYSYVEAKVGASRSFDALTVGALGFYSPDFFGAAEDEAFYGEVNAAYRFGDRFTGSAALGRQWVSSTFDYTTWNVGGTFALTDTFGLDVRYYDTDEHGFGDIYDGRVVASLKATF